MELKKETHGHAGVKTRICACIFSTDRPSEEDDKQDCSEVCIKIFIHPTETGRSEGEKGGGEMQGRVEEMDGEEKRGKKGWSEGGRVASKDIVSQVNRLSHFYFSAFSI